MEEAIFSQIASVGVVGVVGAILFKKFLEDDKIKDAERKEEQKYYREELKTTREAFQEELKKQREVYINSIEKITSSVCLLNNKVCIIEEDIKYIKNKIDINNEE